MRKIIESIYGYQYEELVQNGKDGNKARQAGNLLVSAFIIVFLFLLLLTAARIPGVNDSLNHVFHKAFGYSSGKSIGRLLAIPLLAIIYFIVKYLIGSETQFKKYVDAFASYPEEEKKNSMKRIMVPFMGMLALMLVLALV
jgi:hypothetical protein